MDAFCCFSFAFTLLAGQLDGEDLEHLLPCGLISHPHQAGVEIDLAGEGGDGEKGGISNNGEGSDGLIKKTRIDVGCLLEDEDIPASSLRGTHLVVVYTHMSVQGMEEERRGGDDPCTDGSHPCMYVCKDHRHHLLGGGLGKGGVGGCTPCM